MPEHPIQLHLRAQKAAARVLGSAEALLGATRAVLAEREAELLELKGPCTNGSCPLHLAHRGPCGQRPRNVHCSNCGDTRGGPVGHEISECTFNHAPSA